MNQLYAQTQAGQVTGPEVRAFCLWESNQMRRWAPVSEGSMCTNRSGSYGSYPFNSQKQGRQGQGHPDNSVWTGIQRVSKGIEPDQFVAVVGMVGELRSRRRLIRMGVADNGTICQTVGMPKYDSINQYSDVQAKQKPGNDKPILL